ncbi:MAG: hypothetical protein HZA14_12170 [Nitrospirae bacterium]|nr:hypothetical protein [Nitrospirota bacterium]
MDIAAINGPIASEGLQPPTGNYEVEPVGAVLTPIINESFRIRWNVRDRVTISPEARRRYEESRASKSSPPAAMK